MHGKNNCPAVKAELHFRQHRNTLYGYTVNAVKGKGGASFPAASQLLRFVISCKKNIFFRVPLLHRFYYKN